jgi:two-component system, NarL family, nitrate/nitrite sensor histidine kinase NarX
MVSSNENTEPRLPAHGWRSAPLLDWWRETHRLHWRPLFAPLFSLFVLLVLAGIVGFLAQMLPQLSRLLYSAQIIFLLGGIGCIGLTLWRVKRELLEPLAELRRWAKRMREGDLWVRVPITASGEFTELARDINDLGDELRMLNLEMTSKVRKHTQHLSHKTRSLEILYDISSSLNRSRNLDELLDSFLDTCMDLVDARAVAVRLLNGNGQLRLIASRGLDPLVVEREKLMPVNACLCGTVAIQGGVHIQKGSAACSKVLGQTFLADDCQELVVVPLKYREEIIGVYNLILDKPSSDLGDEARDLFISIGRHLALALEKTRLDENARRLAIIEERHMMGNELHDSLAQSIVSMRLHIKMLGEMLFRKDIHNAQHEVRRLHTSVEDAHTSLRELLANFRSRMDQRGLIPAIEEMVLNFKQETGIAAYFHNECSELTLTPAQEIQVFRITQEALANIRKHSDAMTARIMLRSDDGENYTLLIEDDGLGMTPVESSLRGEHVGISIMRERAERLPGKLRIESEPGEGTRICLNFSAHSPSISIEDTRG